MTRKSDRKAALRELTEAREALAEASPAEFDAANARVLEAEKAVPFAAVRGWDFVHPSDR